MYKEAIENYDLAVKYNVNNDKAFYKRGYCQFKLKNFD